MADLVVGWAIKDGSIAALPNPRSLYFDFPLRSRLRGGSVLLVSPSETLAIKVKKPAVHFIGGHFHFEAVEVVEPQALNRIARGGPWRYVAVDGRGRVAAEGPLNMPPWEEMARRFATLKAKLDQLVAAPNGACPAIADNEEQL